MVFFEGPLTLYLRSEVNNVQISIDHRPFSFLSDLTVYVNIHHVTNPDKVLPFREYRYCDHSS